MYSVTTVYTKVAKIVNIWLIDFITFVKRLKLIYSEKTISSGWNGSNIQSLLCTEQGAKTDFLWPEHRGYYGLHEYSS
ncbi:hypothetical protein GCM10023173_09830 [Sphingobacterium thermophilum]|uniref:Uncharacterized protein n=1 Tax=Sphingobacterium thermophilum TaxID=768534 RepID=A0ABP8QZ83_9SPHI